MNKQAAVMTAGQRRLWRRVQLVLAIVVALVLGYMTFFHVNDHERRLTASAPATIFAAENRHRAELHRYRYTVAGRTYTDEHLSSGFTFPVGMPAKAC
jgi:anti-sigma-K factor RskA